MSNRLAVQALGVATRSLRSRKGLLLPHPARTSAAVPAITMKRSVVDVDIEGSPAISAPTLTEKGGPPAWKGRPLRQIIAPGSVPRRVPARAVFPVAVTFRIAVIIGAALLVIVPALIGAVLSRATDGTGSAPDHGTNGRARTGAAVTDIVPDNGAGAGTTSCPGSALAAGFVNSPAAATAKNTFFIVNPFSLRFAPEVRTLDYCPGSSTISRIEAVLGSGRRSRGASVPRFSRT